MVSKTVVICATIAFVVVIGAFVFLTTRHIDTTSLVSFAVGLASGVVPNMASYFKTHSLQQDVNVVKDQTNGPLTQGLKEISELKETIRQIQDMQHGGTGE